jgi:hypothetical protein
VSFFYCDMINRIFSFVPGSALGCAVFLLALDAAMTGSFLAVYVASVSSFCFGVIASTLGSKLLDDGIVSGQQNLLFLLLVLPLHFFAAGWNLQTAAEIRRSFHGKRDRDRIFRTSFVLMICTFAAGAATAYWIHDK